MKLGIQVLANELRPYSNKISIGNPLAEYDEFAFYRQGETLEKSVIYLENPEEMPTSNAAPASFIQYFTGNTGLIAKFSNVFILNEDITFIETVNLLQNIFKKYNSWESDLKESILHSKGLKSLGNLSISIFENPIIYLNEEYRVSFLTEVTGGIQLNDVYKNQFLEEAIIGDQIMEIIRSSQDFEETITKKGVDSWKEPTLGYEFMFINHVTAGISDGSLMICNCNKPFKSGDEFLLDYLSAFLTESMKRRDIYPPGSLSDLKSLLSNLLNNSQKDVFQARRFASECKWEMHQEYLCLELHLSEKEIVHHTLVYQCNRLEKLFKGSRVFELNNSLVMLINMTLFPDNKQDFLEKLKTDAQKNEYTAGVSLLFHDFADLPIFYKQSQEALNTGSIINKDAIVFDFEIFALDYLLHNAIGSLSILQICPDGLVALIEHDNKNATHFCELLQTYLENDRSTIRSTEKLHLHRSTFLYQLERAKKILSMDLDDKNTRLFLTLLFRIREQNKNIQMISLASNH